MKNPRDGLAYYRLNGRLVEAANLQRKALKLSRWAALDENGAYSMNEAALLLERAAKALFLVSSEILQARARDVGRAA